MYIEFGNLNYKLLVLLIHPSVYTIYSFHTHADQSPLYYSFLSCLGYLLGGLVYLLVLKRSKNHKKLPTSIKAEGKPVAINEIFIENQNEIKQRKFKEIKSIIFISFINLVPLILQIRAKKLLEQKFTDDIGMIVLILYYAGFSKLFLNSKIYNHQFMSLFVIILCIFIYFILDLVKYKNPSFFISLGNSLLYYIVINGFFALNDVFTKRHFETYSNIPYQFMFYLGLSTLLLLISLDLFIYCFNIEILDIDIIQQIVILNSSSNYFLFFLLDIFVRFLSLGGIILTLYYFSPSHYINYIRGFLSIFI